MMRVFIAYTLSDSFKHSLMLETAALRKNHPDFRWTPEQNLHITLAFLGDIDEAGVPLLTEILEEKVPRTPKIKICTYKVFTLPRHGNANVLALGLSRGEEEIKMTAHYIEGRMEQFTNERRYSFRPMEKRPFTVHLSLARKGKTPIRLTQNDLRPIPLESFIEKAVIFQSELTSKGAVYTPLKEFFLNKAD
jgi:2'-5' RNA ligase